MGLFRRRDRRLCTPVNLTELLTTIVVDEVPADNPAVMTENDLDVA